jgi:hypothetical protein
MLRLFKLSFKNYKQTLLFISDTETHHKNEKLDIQPKTYRRHALVIYPRRL